MGYHWIALSVWAEARDRSASGSHQYHMLVRAKPEPSASSAGTLRQLFVDSAVCTQEWTSQPQEAANFLRYHWFLNEQELHLRYIFGFMFIVRTPNTRTHEICYVKY